MSGGQCFIILMAMTICVCGVLSVSFEEDTRITAKQAEVLTRFRKRILSKLPKRYMEEDIYLIRWLKAKNFNIDLAEEMLLQHLQWRRANKVDRVDDEDWHDFESEYPWSISGSDKQGRPIVELIMRDWDIRKAAVAGRREKLVRWTYKIFEDANHEIRNLQKDGKNVTQYSMVVDAEGFNPVTHGCPLCMPYFFSLANIYEQHYPGSVDKTHIVNTPEFFRYVIRLLWPLLAENTRQSLQFHGTDRNLWKKELMNEIDADQLLSHFGGKKSI